LIIQSGGGMSMFLVDLLQALGSEHCLAALADLLIGARAMLQPLEFVRVRQVMNRVRLA